MSKDKETDALVISILENVSKGKTNWKHPVAFEGKTKEEETMCLVYWLNQYFIVKFGLDLDTYENWDMKEYVKELFLWSKENYEKQTTGNVSHFVVNVADRSGYLNIEKVSFHSFRSGFLATAQNNSNLNTNNMTTTMGNVCLIAGWKLNGDFKKSYIKFETRKTLICNNLNDYINPERPITNKNILDP